MALAGLAALVATVLAYLFFARELTAGIFHVSWAPDGQLLAYTTDNGAKSSDLLWVVPADGSEAPRLLLDADVDRLVWGPDGRSIAFAGGPGNRSLWVVDVATGSARELADRYPYGSVEWAPDAGTLAFVGRLGDISIVDAATGRSRVLMSIRGSPGLVIGPEWTGDATAVIVSGARRSGGEGIWAITIEGGVQHLLWEVPVSEVRWLAVEPGVRGQIAVEHCIAPDVDDAGQPSKDECSWFVMHQDGSGLQRLDEAPQWVSPDAGLSEAWLYSPDHRYKARLEGTGTGSALWVDAVDGTSHVLVAER